MLAALPAPHFREAPRVTNGYGEIEFVVTPKEIAARGQTACLCNVP
jgi:hypothetical protein